MYSRGQVSAYCLFVYSPDIHNTLVMNTEHWKLKQNIPALTLIPLLSTSLQACQMYIR